MELPALLSQKYEHYQVEDDMSLLMQLREDLADLAGFVISACDDETWSDKHRLFMEKATIVLTRRFFRMRLAARQALLVAKAFHEHWGIMKSIIPRDLTVLFKGEEYVVNSLLFTVNSPFFRQLVAVECAGNDIKYLKLRNPPFDKEFFTAYLTFCEEEDLPDLWQKKPEELLSFMKMAVDIECETLENFAAETYKRYLDKRNVYLMAMQAYKCGWTHLFKVCQSYVNQLEIGIRFIMDKPGVAVELLDSTENTLDAFALFEDEVTHLTCKGRMAELPLLPLISIACNSLRSLNVSEASKGDIILSALGPKIEALDLTLSDWLDLASLEKIVELCPHLNELSLAKNTQLNYRHWGMIHKWKNLRSLNLASCYQINDNDIKIILQGAPNLQVLNLYECNKLLESGFQSIGKLLNGLQSLNLSRTKVTDIALVDIAYHCRTLRKLILKDCPNITEKGVTVAIKNLQGLQEIILDDSPIPEDVVRNLAKTYRHIKIIKTS